MERVAMLNRRMRGGGGIGPIYGTGRQYGLKSLRVMTCKTFLNGLPSISESPEYSLFQNEQTE